MQDIFKKHLFECGIVGAIPCTSVWIKSKYSGTISLWVGKDRVLLFPSSQLEQSIVTFLNEQEDLFNSNPF